MKLFRLCIKNWMQSLGNITILTYRYILLLSHVKSSWLWWLRSVCVSCNVEWVYVKYVSLWAGEVVKEWMICSVFKKTPHWHSFAAIHMRCIIFRKICVVLCFDLNVDICCFDSCAYFYVSHVSFQMVMSFVGAKGKDLNMTYGCSTFA